MTLEPALRLPGSVKRVAEVVNLEVAALARRFGVERLGFLTLTFPQSVTSIKTAQKRWHSLCSHVLRKRYGRIIATWERHKKGGIHWHCVVLLAFSVPVGTFNFAALRASQAEWKARGKTAAFYALRDTYRASATPELRAEWQFLRDTLPEYQFGRHQLEPCRGDAVALARYCAKYVCKQFAMRNESDKGSRRVRFVGFSTKQDGERVSSRTANANFGWATVGGSVWRAKAASFAESRGQTEAQLTANPRWAHHHLGEILRTDCRAKLQGGGKGAALAVAESEHAERECLAEIRKDRVAGLLERLRATHDDESFAVAKWASWRGYMCMFRASVPAPWLTLGGVSWQTREAFMAEYFK